MKLFILIFGIFMTVNSEIQAQNDTTTVYCFPGQGSDYRVFGKLQFPENFKLETIEYPIPEKGTSLRDFAYLLIERIDTSQKYIFIGHSLGGMICSELADILSPERVIIISSAKHREELPFRYRFQKYIPINKIMPKRILKAGALLLQPIVEPDRNNEKNTFKSMLKAKHPKYMKRTIDMIVNWEKDSYKSSIVHIHGNEDRTLPIRNIKYDYLIENGSHMMVLTRGEEINTLINKIINNEH